MKQHALRVPDELWERIEDARGRLSRNAYIVATLDNGVPAVQWAGIENVLVGVVGKRAHPDASEATDPSSHEREIG